MHAALRQLLVLIVAATFLNGTVGLAFAEPCDDGLDMELPAQGGHHHHDGDAPSCLVCPCCAVVPTLSDPPVAPMGPQPVAYVIYTEHSPVLIGRSVAPDPSPPRPIA